MIFPSLRNSFGQVWVGLLLLLGVMLASGCAGIWPQAELKHYKVTDYGAVADGQTLNTQAIQKTIDSAQAAGGGMVEIPRGTFLSGSIFLKKGVELYLDEGAVLLGSQNIEDYPKRLTRIEGHFQEWRLALVNVEPTDHVRIGGKGQLNGNGAPFWAKFRAARKADSKTTNLDIERPRLMFIDRCTDVCVKGISFQDSGFWNLHLYRCRDVLIEDVSINAPSIGPGRAPSSDGIDIDSCQNVTVRRCQISNGDDDIALKGSKGVFADKDTDSPPVENILIEDCTLGDGGGLITCGSEATLVRNVTVRNCAITGNATLLTLKLRTDTPQRYENILIDGIKLNGGGTLMNIKPWPQYENFQGQPPPTHTVSNVTIRNVSGKFKTLGTLRGNPGDTLQGITLENADLTLVDELFGYGERDEGSFTFKNVIVNGQPYALPPPSLPKPARPAGAPDDAPVDSSGDAPPPALQ